MEAGSVGGKEGSTGGGRSNFVFSFYEGYCSSGKMTGFVRVFTGKTNKFSGFYRGGRRSYGVLQVWWTELWGFTGVVEGVTGFYRSLGTDVIQVGRL